MATKPQSAARFRETLTALTGEEPTGEHPIGLAVSGGPDSLALLLMAHECYPGAVAAATVDHELRAAAAEEAVYVATLCSERNIPHAILRPDEPISGNIQSQARVARYTLQERWANGSGIRWIATAHHADDQLETVLMRLARGSGLSGLAGIRQRNGRIVRPLLGFTKAELKAICSQAGVKPVCDPSNEDESFDRVRMRRWLDANEHPFVVGAVARSAGALAESEEALDWMTVRFAESAVVVEGATAKIDPSGYPREIRRRLLLKALEKLQATRPRGETIERALDMLESGHKTMIGNWQIESGNIWRISPAPPRRTG